MLSLLMKANKLTQLFRVVRTLIFVRYFPLGMRLVGVCREANGLKIEICDKGKHEMCW